MTLDDEILAVFYEEVGEHLEELASLLERPAHEWDVRVAFRLSHNMKGSARMVGAIAVSQITHALEDLFSALRAGRSLDEDICELARRGCRLLDEQFANPAAILDEAVDEYRAAVEASLGTAPEAPLRPGHGEPLLDESTFAEVDAKVHTEEWHGPSMTPPGPHLSSTEPASTEPSSTEARSEGEQGPLGETVRVATDKLDRLMGLSTEVSISGRAAHYQLGLVRDLTQGAYRLSEEHPELRKLDHFRGLVATMRALYHSVAQSQERHSKFARELHEMARQLRMVPLGSFATVFSRVVRQACQVTGKRAEFRLEGADTELDRAVLDAVRDPLVHLLRNAVAHGIEDEDHRLAAGKPACGRVLLRARSAGAWVELEVCDDGAGLDLGAIRRRAVKLGLLTVEKAERSTPEALERILFAPGFTGAGDVSEISGRGVGLDVVETNLASLGGRVSVENRPGNGISFVLRVPLTLLMSKMLHVRLGEHNLLFPMSSVVTTVRMSNEELQMADGQQVVAVGGRPVPVTGLETLVESKATAEGIRPGVLLAEQKRRRLFLVDQVIGEEDVLIQSLSWNLQALKLFAGCAVLADGEVALVLDVQALLGGQPGTIDADWVRGARERARQRQILVVDDSVTSRTLIENILASGGYAVNVAVDGLEALERCREHAFDLVITDVEMPRMDGFGLVGSLRAEQATARVPIIMVTSLGQEEHKQRAAELGADEYIVKGAFDQDALLAAVARLL